jgi:hypothetical protein
MGVSPDQIGLNMDWHRRGWLSKGDGALDLAAQEVFCASSNLPFAGLIDPAFRQSARAVVGPGAAQALPAGLALVF